MINRIAINWLYGRPRTDAEADEGRAEAAALAVLDGHDAVAAYREYMTQFAILHCEKGMTGLAAVWLNATAAANIALTEGWAKSGLGVAACTIVALDPL